jgi:hypothetical protein
MVRNSSKATDASIFMADKHAAVTVDRSKPGRDHHMSNNITLSSMASSY